MSRWVHHSLTLFVFCALCLAFTLTLAPEKADAHKDNGNLIPLQGNMPSPPNIRLTNNCTELSLGQGQPLCGVNASGASTYFDPKIQVWYRSVFFPATATTEEASLTDRHDISYNKCKWFFWYTPFPAFRVCARLVEPGIALYPGMSGYNSDDGPGAGDNAPYNHHGNNTAVEGFVAPTGGNASPDDRSKPRVQICAYEDPCDMTDPPGGMADCLDVHESPFAIRTTNEDAATIAEMALNGFIASYPNANFIRSTQVHVSNLQRSLDSLSNPSATRQNLVNGAKSYANANPAYGFARSLASTHFNHRVTRDLGCVDIPLAPLPPSWRNDAWNPDHLTVPDLEDESADFFNPSIKVIMCENSDSKSVRCDSTRSNMAEEIILTPNASSSVGGEAFVDCEDNDRGEKLCAKITTDSPENVCVYQRENVRGTNVDTQLGCVDRTGYMPRPELNFTGSVTAPRVSVSFPGDTHSQTLTLTEDPAMYTSNIAANLTPSGTHTGNCGLLHQIRFCSFRKCATEAAATGAGAPPLCQVYGNQMCMNGYVSDNQVVAEGDTGEAIQGYPNIYDSDILQWVHRPPACLERGGQSCYHYAPCNDDPVPDDLTTCSDTTFDGITFNNVGRCCNIASGPTCDESWRDSSTPDRDEDGNCNEFVANLPSSWGGVDRLAVDQTSDGGTPAFPNQIIRLFSAEESRLCHYLTACVLDGSLLALGSAPGAPQLWLDADDPTCDGATQWADAQLVGEVGTDFEWRDKSGNDHVATGPLTTLPRYKTSSINSKPTVRFDGSDDFLNVDLQYLTSTEYTIFVVEKRHVGGTRYFLGSGAAANNEALHMGYRGGTVITLAQHGSDLDATVPGFSSEIPALFMGRLDSSGHKIQRLTSGGVEESATNTNTTQFISSHDGVVGRGHSGNNYYDGDLAEIIIYNQGLNDSDVTAIQSYLGGKWGITLPCNTTGLSVQTGLQLWLDGDDPACTGSTDWDDGQEIGTSDYKWYDKSNNAFEVAAVASTNRPVYRTNQYNGRGAIEFDASNYQYLQIPYSSNLNPAFNVSLFAVAKSTATDSTFHSIISSRYEDSGDNNNKGYSLYAGRASHTWTAQTGVRNRGSKGGHSDAWAQLESSIDASALGQISLVVEDGANAAATDPYYDHEQKLYVNGTLREGYTYSQGHRYEGNNVTTIPTRIGAGRTDRINLNGNQSQEYYFDGHIAEVLMYNRAVSDTERATIEAYLKTKWGTP